MMINVMLLVLLSTASVLVAVKAAKVQQSGSLKAPGGLGNYQYTYNNDDSDPCGGTLVLIGVGTAMSVTDYTQITSAIVVAGNSHEQSMSSSSNMMVVMLDHAPWNPIKTNPASFAKLSNTIVMNLQQLIPVCGATTMPQAIMVGGHSASGQAAVQALEQNLYTFAVAAYVGWDPYKITAKNSIRVPAVLFGFQTTTCLVTVGDAAREAYHVSGSSDRILFRMDNSHSGAPTHCSFTNGGCAGPVCPARPIDTYVRDLVAAAMHRFVASGMQVDAGLQAVASTVAPYLSVTPFANGDPVTDPAPVVREGLRPGLVYA